MTFERHKMNKRVVHDLKRRSTIGIPFYIIIAFCVVFAESLYKRQPLFAVVFLLSIGAFVCSDWFTWWSPEKWENVAKN
jgi:predicted branched-subunit amino acid permease